MDEKQPLSKGVSAWQAMEIVWDIFLAIAIPTVLSALGGRWLDRRFGTTPLFLIIGLFVALAVSGIFIVRKGKAISKNL